MPTIAPNTPTSKAGETSCSSRSCRLLLGLSAVALLAATAFILLSCGAKTSSSGASASSAVAEYERGYAEGFRAARQKALGVTAETVNGEARENGHATLSGHVTAVAGSSITFTVDGVIVDERVDGVGAERTIMLMPETVVSVSQQLSAEAFAKAQREFYVSGKNPLEGQDSSVPPTPFLNRVGTPEDVAVGDYVTVEGAEGGDLAAVAAINASALHVMKSLSE